MSKAISDMLCNTCIQLTYIHQLLQEAIAPQIAGKPIPGQHPADFVFYLDENCEHVTEVLVHSWLDLHECPIETCLVGEMLVAQSHNGQASLPSRMQEEIGEAKPVDILQVMFVSLVRQSQQS